MPTIGFGDELPTAIKDWRIPSMNLDQVDFREVLTSFRAVLRGDTQRRSGLPALERQRQAAELLRSVAAACFGSDEAGPKLRRILRHRIEAIASRRGGTITVGQSLAAVERLGDEEVARSLVCHEEDIGDEDLSDLLAGK